MNAAELFSAGDLASAIKQCAEEVKIQPSSASKRALFVELLCFDGDFERADKQLTALASLDISAAVTVGTWRQLIRAAQARRDVFENGAIPSVISSLTPSIETALAALLALRNDDKGQLDHYASQLPSKA